MNSLLDYFKENKYWPIGGRVIEDWRLFCYKILVSSSYVKRIGHTILLGHVLSNLCDFLLLTIVLSGVLRRAQVWRRLRRHLQLAVESYMAGVERHYSWRLGWAETGPGVGVREVARSCRVSIMSLRGFWVRIVRWRSWERGAKIDTICYRALFNYIFNTANYIKKIMQNQTNTI